MESWSDSATARERVETIATTLSRPRTANCVADQADVKWDTAKKYLDELVDAGELLVTDSGEYLPDPTRAYFDRLRELVLTNDRESLRGELEAIADRIDRWKREYGVDSRDELEQSLAGDLDAEAIRDRRRVIRRWETSERTRETIASALSIYDDVTTLTDELPDSATLETAG
ncbi:winged helix-turn-helix domain-containing protein [Halovivax limisalsi]|uniref:winged helix-turn-helix domain-containing protein n=1 Tax=Halovivax limisalsi TaxID=1453760 RepID=UPI001FFDCBDB|nr:winged helix-turn-helix domain-containing protein [Halovivax limisalsi]